MKPYVVSRHRPLAFAALIAGSQFLWADIAGDASKPTARLRPIVDARGNIIPDGGLAAGLQRFTIYNIAGPKPILIGNVIILEPSARLQILSKASEPKVFEPAPTIDAVGRASSIPSDRQVVGWMAAAQVPSFGVHERRISGLFIESGRLISSDIQPQLGLMLIKDGVSHITDLASLMAETHSAALSDLIALAGKERWSIMQNPRAVIDGQVVAAAASPRTVRLVAELADGRAAIVNFVGAHDPRAATMHAIAAFKARGLSITQAMRLDMGPMARGEIRTSSTTHPAGVITMGDTNADPKLLNNLLVITTPRDTRPIKTVPRATLHSVP